MKKVRVDDENINGINDHYNNNDTDYRMIIMIKIITKRGKRESERAMILKMRLLPLSLFICE